MLFLPLAFALADIISVAFAVVTLAAAYLGLAPSVLPAYKQSDKVLHFITFFLLTV
jgi:hypothetical protein